MTTPPPTVGWVSPQGVTRQDATAEPAADVGLREASPTSGDKWIETTIGEQVTLQRGFDITKATQQSGAVPVISSGGINSYHNLSQARGPGVVLGRKGVVGSVYFVRDDYWPHDTTLWVKDFHGNDALFTYYFFRARASDLAALDVGSANPTLNRNHVHPIKTLWPPLKEQQAIAVFLGILDDRITLLRETNATLEAIAQALFKSWFVDFDPVRARQQGLAPEGMDEATAALFPDGFEESELGLVPKGWRAATISAVSAQIFSGGTPDTRKPEYWVGDIPWFSSGETRNSIVVGTEKQISQLAVENSSTRVSIPGDVLIASAGQGHTRGQTSYNAIRTYINQSVVAVRADKEICAPLWLYYNLSRRYEEMRNLSDSHSSRGSLTTKLLAGMSTIVPCSKVCSAFGEIANAMIEAQVKNELQAQTLSTLRDTLLPRLISGQLRLAEAQAQLESTLA